MRMRNTNLNIHNPGIDDVDFVPVATPNLVVHNMHAADWVVGFAQVQQVVVGKIPLAITLPVEDGHCTISQCS